MELVYIRYMDKSCNFSIPLHLSCTNISSRESTVAITDRARWFSAAAKNYTVHWISRRWTHCCFSLLLPLNPNRKSAQIEQEDEKMSSWLIYRPYMWNTRYNKNLRVELVREFNEKHPILETNPKKKPKKLALTISVQSFCHSLRPIFDAWRFLCHFPSTWNILISQWWRIFYCPSYVYNFSHLITRFLRFFVRSGVCKNSLMSKMTRSVCCIQDSLEIYCDRANYWKCACVICEGTEIYIKRITPPSPCRTELLTKEEDGMFYGRHHTKYECGTIALNLS